MTIIYTRLHARSAVINICTAESVSHHVYLFTAINPALGIDACMYIYLPALCGIIGKGCQPNVTIIQAPVPHCLHYSRSSHIVIGAPAGSIRHHCAKLRVLNICLKSESYVTINVTVNSTVAMCDN